MAHTLRFFLDPFNVSLPDCPAPDSRNKPLTDAIAFPSVSFTYMIIALLALLFGTVTAFQFNSIPVNVVKERKGKVSKTETVRKNAVSNTYWVLYFFCLCFRASFDALRFSLYRSNDLLVDETLSVLSLVFFGISVFILTLALEHQRRHRSAFKKKDPLAINEQINDEFNSKTMKKLEKIWTLVRGPLLLLLLYVTFTLVAYFVQSEPLFYVFLGFYTIQRIPLLVLLAFIVFHTSEEQEGPHVLTRIILIIGTLLYLINEVPITMWAYIISHGDTNPCIIGGVASLVDVIHLLFLISQIIFFIFLIVEFERNKEPCVWTIVSKRHEGYFDFREFEEDDAPPTQPPTEYDQLFKNVKRK